MGAPDFAAWCFTSRESTITETTGRVKSPGSFMKSNLYLRTGWNHIQATDLMLGGQNPE